MAFSVKIKYYNSFWLKKVTAEAVDPATDPELEQDPEWCDWPGLPWNPSGWPTYPFGADRTWNTDTGDPNKVSAYYWYVEESRIRGGYNNTSVDLGAKAYLKEEDTTADNRDASLIYSGIYNSRTGVNNTNQFPSGQEITRSLDPLQGSIQKLHAENTDLTIFQENKTSKALIDKDAVYSAEGSALTTSGRLVIGQIIPYLGEYGISKNPESFAVFGYRKYYTDRYRNKVLRLSRDGITEISNYGMRDYFRDQFTELSDDYQQVLLGPYTFDNTATGSDNIFDVGINDCCEAIPGASVAVIDATDGFQILNVGDGSGFNGNGNQQSAIQDCSTTFNGEIVVDVQNDWTDESISYLNNATEVYFVIYQKQRIVGGYDNYNDEYVLSIQKDPPNSSQDVDTYDTLVYDEGAKGWVSFYTYKPQFVDSLRGSYYSFYDGKLWKHHDLNQGRNTFYNTYNDSTISLVFNPSPSMTKNFNTLSYEGSNGWEAFTGISDPQEFDDLNGVPTSYEDVILLTKSYDEGKYTDGGVIYRSGFDRKENRYVASIINNNREQRIGEIVFGNQMSGIKGYYVTVTLRTDSSTDLAGPKELFAVSSNFVMSSY
jgi:hypothetical protein